MPIFEYFCSACYPPHLFEQIVPTAAEAKDSLPCPKCGRPAFKKLFSTPARRAVGFAGKAGGRTDGIAR